MGLRKGQTNNPNGRPAGALNKVTKDLRINITEFLENHFDEVIKEWYKLKGKEKLMFYRDLLQYAVPKLQSVEMKELQRKETIDLSLLTNEELTERLEIFKIIEKNTNNT
jgi:hypothetical protein